MRVLFIIISVIIACLVVWGASCIFEKLGLFSEMGFLGVIIKIGIVVGVFLLVYLRLMSFLGNYDYTDAYITTKMPLNYYEKIEKEPDGKELGTIKTDTVIKVSNFEIKKNISWVDGYILSNNKPKHLFVLIPSTDVEIKQNCEYFDFNEKSRSFSAYYESIDKENAATREQIKNSFINELNLNNIKVSHSSDPVLKESIEKSCYIFPNKGFLDAFISSDTDFYYIDKNQKKDFMKIYNSNKKELNKNLKPYFN